MVWCRRFVERKDAGWLLHLSRENSIPKSTINKRVKPLPIEVSDITNLLENVIDILTPSREVAQRASLAFNWSEREQLLAEHGYSLLLTVNRDGRSESVLYDVGLG